MQQLEAADGDSPLFVADVEKLSRIADSDVGKGS